MVFNKAGIYQGPTTLEWQQDAKLNHPGWWKLMEPIFEEIARTPPAKIAQIKEKFGGLRFYMDISSEAIDDLIKVAEDESYRTCEHCGEPGKPRSGGWILTLCAACKEKHDRNRSQ